jgi:ABC-type uncharacterized transport system ATPase subunit
MSAALTISMHDSAPNRTILYLNGVTVSFDGFKALNNLSLVIEEGELRAIIGPNGAGKSTMMDVITGLTKPDSGEVIFQQNIDLTRHDEAHIANLGIGRKFQKPSCIGSLTVHDNLDLALRGQRRLFSAPCCASAARSSCNASTSCWSWSGSSSSVISPPAPSPMARSSGWRSACCWRRIRNCCWSMNRWPA